MSDEDPAPRKVAELGFWREARLAGQPKPDFDADDDGGPAAEPERAGPPGEAEPVTDLGAFREARRRADSPKPKPDDDGGDHGGGGDPPDGPEGGGPPGEPSPIWCSDDSLAVRLVNKLAPDWRYVATWAQWMHWDEVRWVEDDQARHLHPSAPGVPRHRGDRLGDAGFFARHRLG